ncbi:unnamed protein product [Phyllotreta striolata]|uniref:Fatty acyl-CoA reductase n=1 Tax=Phyllotreta striolata TaxID=444603 RepID=A0A9N9TIU3_PHYSR|nr:unnamed protein product [Phyllotreta striolata]
MENLNLIANKSTDRIAEIFYGRTIFISGATGFVGKALLEKLLRITQVKRIYVLIRNKKGKSANDRLQNLFTNVLFETVLSVKPSCTKKCTAINGDVNEVDLGISPAYRQTLINEVNFIFHCAASTRFDDSMRTAFVLNVRGTKYMLDLAEQCKHLMLFVHISTAYAFHLEAKTLEKEYKSAINPHDILKDLNCLDGSFGKKDVSELSGDLIYLRRLLQKVPNSYTFSKSLAETLVYEKVGKIPIIICRPAIVIPSYEDPFPGWFNNLQGPMGLFVAAGKGVMRSIYMDCKTSANLCPIDSTVGSIMMFSWHYLTTKNSPYIFNLCVPQTDIRVTWEEILEAGKDVIKTKVPFNGILWYPGGTMTKNRLYDQFNFVCFQLIPALLIDFLLFLLGYKPLLYKVQMRIRKGGDMFEYFTTKNWSFETTNLETVREKLTDHERKSYMVKVEKIDMKKYLTQCMLACRRNYLKETDDTLPAAKRNMKIMFCLDRIVKIGFFVFLAYYMFKIFKFLL